MRNATESVNNTDASRSKRTQITFKHTNKDTTPTKTTDTYYNMTSTDNSALSMLQERLDHESKINKTLRDTIQSLKLDSFQVNDLKRQIRSLELKVVAEQEKNALLECEK